MMMMMMIAERMTPTTIMIQCVLLDTPETEQEKLIISSIIIIRFIIINFIINISILITNINKEFRKKWLDRTSPLFQHSRSSISTFTQLYFNIYAALFQHLLSGPGTAV